MIYFKACPRCRGDMHLGKDHYGRYIECIQCGYEAEVKTASEVKEILDVSLEETAAEAA